MIRKTARGAATEDTFPPQIHPTGQPANAGVKEGRHVASGGGRRASIRRWLSAVAVALLAMATLSLGYGSAQADAGAQTFEVSLDGKPLLNSESLGGLVMSGNLEVVIRSGPLDSDGRRSISVRTILSNAVASNATTSCRITGEADRTLSIDPSERFRFTGFYKFRPSESCYSSGEPGVHLSFTIDGEGKVVSLGPVSVFLHPVTSPAT